MDPTEAAARLAATPGIKGGGAKSSSSGAIDKAEDAKYLGCFSSESFFGSKEYVGGASGANYNLIYHYAKQVSSTFVVFDMSITQQARMFLRRVLLGYFPPLKMAFVAYRGVR